MGKPRILLSDFLDNFYRFLQWDSKKLAIGTDSVFVQFEMNLAFRTRGRSYMHKKRHGEWGGYTSRPRKIFYPIFR